ncbi:MAG: hypothetical protein Q8936_19320 [Bacillota bacterium]|nr:hypothetical protein [Bacillota bacterium]
MLSASELIGFCKRVADYKGNILLNFNNLKLDRHGYAVIEGLSLTLENKIAILVNPDTYADIIMNHRDLVEFTFSNTKDIEKFLE